MNRALSSLLLSAVVVALIPPSAWSAGVPASNGQLDSSQSITRLKKDGPRCARPRVAKIVPLPEFNAIGFSATPYARARHGVFGVKS